MIKKMLKKQIAGSTPAPPSSNGPAQTPAPPSSGSSKSSDAQKPAGSNTKADEDKFVIVPLALYEIPDKKEILEPLPSFKEVSTNDRQALLIKKLKLCCILFDFSDPNMDTLGKEMKRQILLELVDHISTTQKWFSEAVLREFIRMVSINLFRAFPPNPNEANFDPEDQEPVLDPAWSHLQIVYEFLLRFVVSTSTDAKQMRRYINNHFVLQLLDLFKSEDPRERDYLKTILHRIYGKFMTLRLFIRKAIQNVFFEFIYDTEKHAGVGEILEILGSIINGFALPLKDEHKKFLKTVLIPLHKSKSLLLFHQQLSYCVTQFLDKDPTLSSSVIKGLLNFWPVTSSAKEVLFLNELEEVLELTKTEEFQEVAAPLFQQVAKSISSKHFQVAERALFLWNNEYISSMSASYRQVVLPILYPALHSNSKQHWNQTVNTLTFNVIRMFMEVDGNLFDEVAKSFADMFSSPEEMKKRREAKWNKVYEKARLSKAITN